MSYLYIFIGIMVVIPLAQWLMLVIKLYGIKLTQVKFKPLAGVKLPRATQQQFNCAQQELEQLGFTFSHLIAYRDLIASNNKPMVEMVMRNDQHQCYAMIANPHNPDHIRPYAVRFQSFSKQLIIEAMDADAEGVITSFNQLHAFNYQSADIKEGFTEFLQVRDELTKEQDLTQLYYSQPDIYCKYMQQCYDRYLRHLYQNSILQKHQGGLQFRFKEAIKLAWQIFTNRKKVKLIKPEAIKETISKYPFLPKVQAQAHRKLQNNQQSSQLGHWGKTLLFFASALIFALLFGIAWSPFLVIILIPVLLFHELGHFLVMKLFGYRDLQILFLPIGAMVSGNKQQPTAMQRTLVSLAGPVPGLLLAFGLAVWAPDFIYSEYGLMLVFMLLIINYLNLLPFMPLDGGHVVNLLLFDRWPILQFVLMLISVMIFALGAWAWSDPILTILAVIFGLGLKDNFQQAQYVIKARKKWGNKLKNRDNLAVVYYMMKDNPAPFVSKYESASTINDRLSHPSPSIRDSLLGMAMYLTALVGPLVVVDKVIGIDLLPFLLGTTQPGIQFDADEVQQWEPEYWQTQFQNASTTEQKKKVLNNALNLFGENDDFYTLSLLSSQAISLYESNQWQQDPAYPKWLKYQMLYQISENPNYQAQDQLNKLADILGADSLEYTEILVEVSAWQTIPNYKTQLMNRLDQLESNQKYETLLSALISLESYYEQDQQTTTYEQLIAGYLGTFKTNAPTLYPQLRQNYFSTLFIQKKYRHILEMAKQDRENLSFSELDKNIYELEMLAWAALLDHQYPLAKSYHQQGFKVEQQQQEQLKDEIGFLAGLVLFDQVGAMSVKQDPLFNLALAVQQNNPTLITQELNAYISWVENWQKIPFKQFLDRISSFNNPESKQLHQIKYQFLFKAIRADRPELLTEQPTDGS